MSNERYAKAGWMMFAVSGVFFLISAIRSGDPWSLGAAITWIIGVGLFMVDGRSGD